MSKKSKLPSLVRKNAHPALSSCLQLLRTLSGAVWLWEQKGSPKQRRHNCTLFRRILKVNRPNHRLLLMPLKTNHHNMASLLTILLFASVRDSKLSSYATFRIHLTLAGLPPPLSPLETVFISLSDASVQLCVSPRAIIRWWVKCIYTGKSGRSVQKLIDGGKA